MIDQAVSPIVPTRSYVLSDTVKGIACGKSQGDFRDLQNNPGVFERVVSFVKEQGVRRILIPDSTEFNALVATPGHFIAKVRTTNSVDVRQGVRTDGVFITRPGDACLLKSGDCPTVVISFPDGQVCVAHAGLGSVVNIARIRGMSTCRGHESVIDKIFELRKGSAEEARAMVVCGIQAHSFKHPFDHPEYGAHNQSLVSDIVGMYGEGCVRSHNPGDLEKGMIDLFKIIRAQLVKYGVRPGNVIHDNVNTADGSGEWYSHRAYVELSRRCPDPKRINGRNMVMFWREG